MSSTDNDRALGDYRLKRLMLETPFFCQWLAEQESIGRKVLLDELKPEAAHHRDKFLADVRAKAAIEHPLIASVYEAVAEDDACYFAHEYLPGGTLEARRKAEEAIKPLELAQLLRRIAQIQKQFEKDGQSTAPLGLDHVHLDSHGVLRLANLAVKGERSEDESVRDMSYLGRALMPLVADGKEGSTRMLTLLSWMRGEGDGEIAEALSWSQVIELCERVERQLTGEPTITRMAAEAMPSAEGRGRPVGLMLITGALALAVVILLVMRLRPDDSESGGSKVLPEPITVPWAEGPGADDSAAPSFRISAYEVTIGDYQKFLETLDSLEQAGGDRSVFDHPEQPAAKQSHAPDDWEQLLAAARGASLWNERRVNLDTPVVGVDWWDAMAYCEWKQGRLPRQEEWVAALGGDPAQVAEIPAADWGPVDPGTADRTVHGVLNLAGSVSEWTLLPTADPVNPLGQKKWLLLGGSYLLDQGHALSRDWADDRSLRRPDLGFRVVFDAK